MSLFKHNNNIISIHGSYYDNNYGDILLLQLFAGWIREVCPNVQFNLPNADRETMKELPEGSTGFKDLIRSKALVFCGGGHLGEPADGVKRWSRRNFRRHLVWGLIAILFRIPIALIGVEFGPLSVGWYRRLSLFIARNARMVVVRNPESRAFLDSHNVKNSIFAPDPIFALSDHFTPLAHEQRHDQVVVHLHAIALHPERYQFIVEALISAIKTLGRDTEIVFVEDDYQGRYQQEKVRPIFRLLEAEGMRYEVFKYEGCLSLIRQINEASYVFTSKLHVGITAAALSNRVLSLWNHPKTPRHHAVIGNQDNCIPFSRVDNAIEDKLVEFLSSPTFSLPEEIKQQARQNKEYTQTFIKSICNK